MHQVGTEATCLIISTRIDLTVLRHTWPQLGQGEACDVARPAVAAPAQAAVGRVGLVACG